MKASMSSHSRSYEGTEDESRKLGTAIAISALGHITLFAALVLLPQINPSQKFSPAVISVTMVSMPAPGPPAAAEPAPVAKPEPAAPVSKPPEEPAVSLAPQPVNQPEPAPDVVSLAPEKEKPAPEPKIKESLKKKTFKPRKVVQKAIDRIEKQVAAESQDPLRDAFSKLKESVAKQSATRTAEPGKTAAGPAAPGLTGLPGGSGAEGGQAVEAIDIYRVEIALQIQQNWAFSTQLAGSAAELKASLVFKVMPNGEIRDVFFTDRSGNRYLDESAYKAIMKSNPVKPHPPGVILPFVQVGLRFTPEGIQ